MAEQAVRPTATGARGTFYTQASPFERSQVFAAAALYGQYIGDAAAGPAVAGRPITFIIPTDLILQPAGTGFFGPVDVDFDNGLGIQRLFPGIPFETSFGTSGRKSVRVFATIAGAVRQSTFSLYVRSSTSTDALPGLLSGNSQGRCLDMSYGVAANGGRIDRFTSNGVRRVYCGIEPDASYAWRPVRNGQPVSYTSVLDAYDSSSRVARYDWAVSLAPGHTQITNPVIIISGYDPLETTGLHSNYGVLIRSENGPIVDLDVALKNAGYDVVVMDFEDSQDFIQRNGLALVHLIRHLHSQIGTNGRIPAVIGLSMGGLVTRYALDHMERQINVPHRVGLFVSYDSPQQGAVLPVGFEMMAGDLYDAFDTVLDIEGFFGGPGNNFLERRFFGAATQQLSTFWTGSAIGATSPTAVQTDVRRDLYADFVRLGDYPANVRRVAISNGNGGGRAQLVSPEWTDTSRGRMVAGAPLLDFRTTLSALWGLSSRRYRFEVWNAPSGSQGVRTVYQRSDRTCFIACPDWDVDVVSQTSSQNPYDIVPGGYLASYEPLRTNGGGTTRETLLGAFAAVWLGLSSSYEVRSLSAERHAFVPTLSALDWNATGTTAASRTALINSTFIGNPFIVGINPADRVLRTPFDDVMTTSDTRYPSIVKPDGTASVESQRHLFITNGIKQFILDQLALPIPDRSLTASITGPTTRAHSQSGTWSSTVSAGQPGYSRRWAYQYACPFTCGPFGCTGAPAPGDSTEVPRGTAASPQSGEPDSFVPPDPGTCGVWNDGGTATTFTSTFYTTPSVTLRLTATDASSATVQRTHQVTFTGGSARGIGTPGEASSAALAAMRTGESPVAFALAEARPNPFGTATTIAFALPEPADVRLTVYDALGREVAILASGMTERGVHEAVFEATGLPAGVYLVRLQAGADVATRSLTLVR